ncbi:MAG: hypothetical protein MUC43_04655 [Pirellula sp.]|jgi:hypothetical protein|nr:hypothetical protein [Pirellula sp.]
MTLGEASSRDVAGLSATEFVQWLFVFVQFGEELARYVTVSSATTTNMDFAANPS